MGVIDQALPSQLECFANAFRQPPESKLVFYDRIRILHVVDPLGRFFIRFMIPLVIRIRHLMDTTIADGLLWDSAAENQVIACSDITESDRLMDSVRQK